MKNKKLLHTEILIVDDKPDNLKILIEILETEGYKLYVATGGKRALSQLEIINPQLIILDILMPGMDGIDTCKAIKTMPGLEDVPIIFVTALSDIDTKIKAFQAGGVDFISKPFLHEEVMVRIESHLTLALQQKELIEKNKIIYKAGLHYQNLFENSPVSLWEENITEVMSILNSIPFSEKNSIIEYLNQNPKIVSNCINSIKILNVNKAAVKLYRATSKEKLISSFADFFNPKSWSMFKEILVSLKMGKKTINGQTEIVNANNELHFINLQMMVIDDFQHIIIAMTDVTPLQEIQNKLKTQNAEYLSLNEEYLTQNEEYILQNEKLRSLSDVLQQKNELITSQKNQLSEAQRIASLGYWHLNNTYNKIICSEQACLMLEIKYPNKEISLNSVLNSIVEFDRIALKNAFDLAIAHKKGFELELKAQFSNNKIKYFVIKTEPEWNSEEKVLLFKGTIQEITLRKIVEIKLKEQSLFVSTLMNNLNVAVMSCNDKGEINFCNKKALEVLNLTTSDSFIGNWLSKSNKIFRKETQLIRISELPLQAAINGKIYEDEEEINIEDNKLEIKTYISKVNLLIDENGNQLGAVWSLYDISDRILAEQEIKKLSVAVEQSANMIVITDTQGIIEYVNPSFIQITGHNTADVLGKKHNIFKPGFFSNETQNELSNALKEGNTWKKEYQNKRKNGEKYWEQATVRALVNKTGKTIKYLAVKEDISKRKEAEQEIKKQSDFLNYLFDYSLDSIAILDKDYNFIRVSNAYAKSDEKQPGDYIGKNHFEMYPTDFILEADAVKTSKQIYYQLARPFVYPQAPDRGTSYWDIAFVPVLNQTNEIELFILSMKNVTEQTLAKIELIKAKEIAEESDKLKSEFLNNMSHEIRTPMNGILGFSDLLSKPNISEEKKKQFISIIQNSSKQLLRVIEDIIEISKLETKQVKLSESEFCINNTLFNLFSIFDMRAKENNLSLYLKKGLNDGDCYIKTDESKLNKILSNLLENAIKYTHQGYVELGYNLLTNNDISNLEIYVKDTGIGIKPENHNKIFHRFTQEEKELSAKSGGLGLGLSIAKENAELLGGNIRLESEKGKGSTFYVSLPYNPIINKTFQKAEEIITYEENIILVAEDEEVNYLYLEALIEEEIAGNIKILHAKNGSEAIQLSMNPSVLLVLMDLKMPILDGFVATRRIKALRPDLPIIAQSAYATSNERSKAMNAGCSDFLTKPINENVFKAVIGKYIKLDN